ncbi:hypothetical protein THIOM_000655 [Candidatus Thiomargarita nelsonii]|uniref:Uncharacterized protein n=1 Tax=Candidatus Thiomargarita nelsonii TaxID=1003181 RepID=A0A176S663_9GAMM|nr:hypothetical protein THIOM_000655 [Candidatus Thiomargarita nelsonii]
MRSPYRRETTGAFQTIFVFGNLIISWLHRPFIKPNFYTGLLETVGEFFAPVNIGFGVI